MKHDRADLLNEALLLLELALIVGRMSGFDLKDRCREFMRILMARKNLSFGAVWIRADLLRRDGPSGEMHLVRAAPRMRGGPDVLRADEPDFTFTESERFRILRTGDDGFAASVARIDAQEGCIALFRLGEIGTLKLHSADDEGFVARQASQLASVVETFTISLEGALAEMRFRREAEERKEMEARLAENARMKAIGQLTGGVAHDFNNLLAAIQGCAEFLELDQAADAEMVGGILDATRRGAELTQRLLAYARQQPLRAEPVDLRDLVAGMNLLLHRSIGGNVAIDWRAEPGLWPAFADARQVEDALLNLAINARDAMPNGGRLSIACRNVVLTEESGGGAGAGDYVALSVKDEGIGMTNEVMAKIFEPFFTTKGAGNGMGLATVYGFARQSGGHLTVDSRLGEGSTFTLYLPRSEMRPADQADRVRPALPVGRGERILIVEDEPAVRALTIKSLASLGYAPSAASEAAGALTLAEEDGPFDLLLSDINLPGGMNGPAIYAELSAEDPNLRVVFMSGFAQDAEEVVANHPTLSKPFRRDALAITLRAALDA